jgi:hypothetical protein
MEYFSSHYSKIHRISRTGGRLLLPPPKGSGFPQPNLFMKTHQTVFHKKNTSCLFLYGYIPLIGDIPKTPAGTRTLHNMIPAM